MKKEEIEKIKELEQFKHNLKMEEIKFKRESDRLHHERELERGRIRSAEIRKTLLRKGY